MIILHKLFIYNWVGRFSSVFLIIILMLQPKQAVAMVAINQMRVSSNEVKTSNEALRWEQFSKEMEKQEYDDYRNGMSYIISGSIALAGGLLGDTITNDYMEKGIYTIFQTIGVASIGYGAYVWKIGSNDRSFYKTLELSKLSVEQKMLLLRSYNHQKKLTERNERIIRAITHGLIAGLNFYSASRQKNDSVKNGLNFVGGVNLLAAFSFTFEF